MRHPGFVALALAAGLLVASPTVPHAVGPFGHVHDARPAHLVLSDRLPMPSGAISHPLPPDESVQLSFALEPARAAELGAFDRALADATSPAFRQFMTEPEFESTFSPPTTNVSSVVGYLSSIGARAITVSPDRLGVAFVLPAGDADRAFSTQLIDCTIPDGAVLRTTSSPPTLPAALNPQVLAIGGLGGIDTGSSAGQVPRPAPGAWASLRSLGEYLNGTGVASGPQWIVGSDFANAFHESQLFPGSAATIPNPVFPTGQAVATLLMSSYNDSTRQDLPPWDPTQIDTYYNETLGPGWPRPTIEGVPVAIDNVTPPAPGSLGFLNDTSLNEEENSLDLEMAGSTAPGARLVNFYFAASLFVNASASTTYGTIADDFGLALASALAHNYSPNRLSAVSGSFGLPDLNDSLWNTELAHAAAIGVSVVVSSGDQGNAPDARSGRSDGPWPTWPASATFEGSGAIALGGTSVRLSGSSTGTFDGSTLPPLAYDPSVTGLLGQSAWYDAPVGGNVSGTEGGISLQFPEPAWQFVSAAQPAIASTAGSEAVVALGRAEPDLAFPANDTFALIATHPGPSIEFAVLAGTSISAPLFAGLLAEWSAVANRTFGFLDPELYRIGSYYASHPGPDDPLLDVSSGHNYAFSAVPGWDATTGWGGVDAVRFLAADANATIRGYVYTGPTPGLPPRMSGEVPTSLVIAIPLGVTLAGVVVIWIALERRTAQRIRGTGAAQGPPPNGPAGTWFTCPYCGAPRPSEPVRCPGCGRF